MVCKILRLRGEKFWSLHQGPEEIKYNANWWAMLRIKRLWIQMSSVAKCEPFLFPWVLQVHEASLSPEGSKWKASQVAGVPFLLVEIRRGWRAQQRGLCVFQGDSGKATSLTSVKNSSTRQRMGCGDGFNSLAWRHLECEDLKGVPEAHTYCSCSLFRFLA